MSSHTHIGISSGQFLYTTYDRKLSEKHTKILRMRRTDMDLRDQLDVIKACRMTVTES